MVQRRLAVAFVGSLFALTILSACTDKGGSVPSSAPPTPAINATAAPSLPSTVNGLPAMDVAEFHALLGQLKGTPVVVNVWAAWCGPCRTEAPLLVAAAKANPGVQFLGVDIEDSIDGARTFLSTYAHGITYPSVFDPKGAIKTDLGAFGQPDTYFYDATGSQVDAVPGLLSSATLQAGLTKATAAS
jgi:cytochrome c biogenesis protein CcmG/thiol:disulfide interchange protein DsbE